MFLENRVQGVMTVMFQYTYNLDEKGKNMKNKKYVFAIIMFCVAVGVIYAIAMCFPEEQSQIIILGVAIAVVVIWMVGKMINMVRLNKIMSAPIPLLYEEKRPDLYIEEMDKISAKVHSKQQKDLIRINVAAARIYNGEFQNALDTLEQVALPGQPVVHQLLVHANRVMAYYLLDQKKEAVEVVEKNRNVLKRYENTSSGLTNNIMVTYAIEHLAKREYEQALEYLDSLKEKKVSSILQDVVDYLYCECYRNLKREGERAELKRMMLEGNLVPGIRKKLERNFGE